MIDFSLKTIMFSSIDEYENVDDRSHRYKEGCNLSNIVIERLPEGQVPGKLFRLHCTHWLIEKCESQTIDGSEIKFYPFDNNNSVYGYLSMLETLW